MMILDGYNGICYTEAGCSCGSRKEIKRNGRKHCEADNFSCSFKIFSKIQRIVGKNELLLTAGIK